MTMIHIQMLSNIVQCSIEKPRTVAPRRDDPLGVYRKRPENATSFFHESNGDCVNSSEVCEFPRHAKLGCPTSCVLVEFGKEPPTESDVKAGLAAMHILISPAERGV